ncbi:MAG: sodium:proton antiporter [Devosia sp.]
MEIFEWIVGLMLAAALLSMLARRLSVPYPSLLALGGAAIALWPESPSWALDPRLALTLFVAPVLLDAAFDFSLRELQRNWISVTGLAVVAVIITTAAVAVVARWLVPGMSWPVAIALGAIVAPPDAAAASAVMQQIKLPHRIRAILEGESLVNDASALLIYRLAVGAALTSDLSIAAVVPTAIAVIVGSIAVGILLALVVGRLLRLVHDAPTAIILQFVGTFGVWILADNVGLSGILTIVAFAITAARSSSRLLTPPGVRIPTNAVWAAVVFMLNALAFVLIGMQLRPILGRLGTDGLAGSLMVALAVLATAIVARFAWVMSYNIFFRAVLPVPTTENGPGRPTIAGGIVTSWAGMRGIVTLAAAFALPNTLPDGTPFPYRDLILLCAFSVVLGTLVVQGLTLRPLIAALRLKAPDPVEREVRQGRAEALRAGLAAIDGDTSTEAKILRKEFEATIAISADPSSDAALDQLPGNDIRRRALAAARRRANELRLDGTIGDEAFRALESEFDWGELSAGADA